MDKELNVTEILEFVEALEKQGLTSELASKVANSGQIAKATVLAIKTALENIERFPKNFLA